MFELKSISRSIGTVLLAGGLLVQAAQAVPVAGQGNWESTLQARDLDGNLSNGAEAYYDTQLGITWLADAFQARTSLYQARPVYAPGDSLIWPHALEWASNLVLFGISDWRLPKNFDAGAPGCTPPGDDQCGFNVNPLSSELAHMFHATLGNISYLTPQGTVANNNGLTNTGPFSNLYAGYYWSETDIDVFHAWNFDFGFGSQLPTVKQSQGSAVWAVLDGDRGRPLNVGPAVVSEPGALGLAGLALLALFSRRRAGGAAPKRAV